jgi:uncharacterized protein YgbK (DUF1537 family)
MRDANLVRVLSRQTTGTVGLVPFATVEQGAQAIRRAMTGLKEQGRRYAIVDAVTDGHLVAIGAAAQAHALITGGSGVAMGLPANFRRAGLLGDQAGSGTALPEVEGYAAVLAGSCSRATLAQIGRARGSLDVCDLDPLAKPDAEALIAQAVEWATPRLDDAPVVIAASATPERVAALQQRLGRAAAGELVETVLAGVAEALVARGVRRLVVAGGETSGAVVSRLGVRSLRIGGEIDPGEDMSAAVLREIAEETGHKSVRLGPPVWYAEHVLKVKGEPRLFQETFILAFTDEETLSDAAWTEDERRVIKSLKWWEADELYASRDIFYPTSLKENLLPIFDGIYPAAILRVEP